MIDTILISLDQSRYNTVSLTKSPVSAEEHELLEEDKKICQQRRKGKCSGIGNE